MSETTPELKRNHKEYLGVTMPFTDNKGNSYPESFWIQDVFIKGSIKHAQVDDIGYKSIASFDAGEPPISPADGGYIGRTYQGARFDAFIKQNIQIVGGMALQGRAHSLLILDTPDAATGQMVSRFAGASPVILPDELKNTKK